MDLDNRMISAKWLKNKFYEICDECNSSVIFIDRIIDEIDDAPDVKVVRCKDCKHWLKDVAGCTEQVGRCEWANYMVGAVGYCVYGERRTNDD